MADSQPDSKLFSVRIVSIDHYMAPPIPDYDFCYSSFQGDNVHEVPIIRVYGSTPAGQKTCLHVHRALPYLYVPCADIPLQPNQEDDAYTHAVSVALEKALKLKGKTGSKRQHVHGCSLVRGKRFYGYHSSEELFVKIYLYYPHDVARAAGFLLGGAVLDKSLQPHESHIPFILQFMVDYNLYGMGHLHLLKVKFRHPVPDVFTTRKFNYNIQQGKELDKYSADFQADSVRSESLSSPFWVSSTIPGDWMWQLSSQFDGLSDQNIKRQSVCELEGDATVDDIVNQQFKMYTSLSQAPTDMKMVQSLLPIWEEEYERTAMREAAVPPDPGKPLPQDVLKILSLGIKFENLLAELCHEGEETISSFENDVKDLKSMTDPEHLSFLKEKNIIASLSQQGLLHGEEIGTTSSQGKDVCPKLSCGSQIQSSEMATEIEALGLLKWLASSQAAEDLNSDDEFLCATILSPLLPETTIDKVLEKANMDYERESQKECQDILDSVDVIRFDGLEERASHSVDPSNHTQISSEKKIPQLDGSSDDLHLCSAESAENSSKIEMKIESKRSLEHQLPQDTGPSFSSKQKKKKKLWGSLPISEAQKVNDDLETDCVEISDICVDESQDCRGTSFSSRNKLAKGSNFSMKNEDANACDTTTLIRCSVRDLMRKKRCYRVEPHESGSLGVKKLLLIGEPKKEISLSPKRLDFNSFQDDEQDKWPLEPSNPRPSLPLVSSTDGPLQVSTGLSSVHSGKRKLQCSFNTEKEGYAVLVNHHEADNSKESDLGAVSSEDINCNFYASKSGSLLDVQLSKLNTEVKPVGDERLQRTSPPIQCDLFALDGSDSVDKYGNERRISTGRVHGISEKKHVGTDITNDKTVLQNEKFIGQEQGQDSGVCGFGCSGSTSTSFNVEGKPLDLVAMTFCRKPPTPDSKDGQFENASCSSPTIPDHSYLVDEENHEGVSGRALDNILPYFERDCPVEKEFQNKWQKNSNCKSHQEDIMGVPTQYLNDGSCLYILAPAFSPPSVDCVNRWLLRDEGAGERNKSSVEPPSPIGSNAMPVSEELHPETDGRVNIESNSDRKEGTTMLQSEGCVAEENACTDCLQDISQISGPDGRSRPTPLSQIGFRDPASLGAGEQLTLLSIEVQSESRGDLRPNPQYDAINVVALAFQNDDGSAFEVYVLLRSNIESFQRSLDGVPDCKVFAFPDEKYLFSHFIKILLSFDPDILMGWDIQGGSLGFLAERAAHLGIGLLNDISRTPSETKIAAADIETSEREIPDNLQPESVIADSVVVENAIIEDEWGRTHASGVHVGGRIVLNVWRLMRGEVKLNMYTMEAVAEAVLRQKTPSIPYKVLTKWFSSGPGRARYRCIEYVVGRAKLNLEIMNQLDMINRTSELARVFGIDFFSVLSRGSQYRVESMFLRLAHTQNYLAISPGHQQVASQPAMECIPLVMEPESGFYSDPVVVLDFQSLYPSMIIAYNLCFCTCLGKVVPSKENTLGVSSFSPDPRVLRDLKDQILLTPNGVMYVPSKICKGVLPRLLEEILSTRIMVKQAMKKLAPSQQVLHRIFNARQLALKLIANVTYGYTAAGFSGRMPCAELADSIVQCGRSTLERAISFVNANDKWKARVIYGDTDSMFVLLKGRTVKESLQIGHEIASAITAMNPYPVVLKMEKVYHPCFLLTKKRYVGYSYESPDQTKPVFDAKGIETVRRDTCGAVSKMLEKSLKLFFEHQDIYEVKAYLQRQWTRILSGRISLQDFIFAKEVRLGSYSTRSSSSLPPAAIVATKAMRADPRAEPCYGERVLYVVIHGEPGARLVDMVVDPLDLLAVDSPYRLNDLYYINKQIIPALQRVFGLVGADLNHWFLEMPRPSREALSKRPFHASNSRRSRIDFYYLSKHCILCGELVQASAPLCNKCSQNQIAAATAIIGRTSKLEEDMQHLAAICRQCGGGDWLVETGVKCTSLACSVFYERRKVQKELQGLSTIAADKGYYPKCMVEWF